jgi:transcriptional regulator
MRKTEFLKGTLDMLILKVVALGPIHGYAIAQRIQQISQQFFQLQQGSLYPALHRLEDRDWLEAEWKLTESGREAKFYSLTKKGRKQLAAEVSHWERMAEAVALILRTAE